MPEDKLQAQGARCMDCGIPFCHKGCPLGNIIPDWNDLIYRGRFKDAIERLHMTNNFPEFTGRVCPAPCEEACVLNINSQPVTIKLIEKHIIDHAFAEGWVTPVIAQRSGPARRSRWLVRAPRDWPARSNWRAPATVSPCSSAPTAIGGLLMYGIPDFKMEKSNIYRRLEQMRAEGVEFKTSCHVGVDYPVDQLRDRVRRDLPDHRVDQAARPSGAGARARRDPFRDASSCPCKTRSMPATSSPKAA